MANKKEIPMVVTTAHRGVFFGYGRPTTNKTVRLTQVQMCVYWSSDVKGVLGLAAQGPTRRCKIGPPVPAMTIQDVTGVIETSKEAATAWANQPWN